MALKQTQDGDIYALEQIRARWNVGGGKLTVHLFTNTPTISDANVPSDFTAPTYEGYAAQDAANWTAPHIVSSKARTEADPLTFTHAAGATSNSIKGYWCEPADHSGHVQFSELFGTPVTLAVDGDALVLYLQYTHVTE